MKKVLLKDVAQRAGVSIASVSYVLNNARGNRISEETVQKVKQAAEELNYRTNSIAKSLKTQRTYTIGLIVADIANPYFSQIARLIEDEARKRGYTLLIGSCDEDKDRFAQLAEAFCDRQVDGLLVTPVAGSKTYLEDLSSRHMPFVMLDRSISGFDGPCIQINNFQISYQATQHLLKTGRKNPVFVDFDLDLEHLILRENGFKSCLADHQLSCHEHSLLKINIAASNEEISNKFKKLFAVQPKPDALLISSNQLSIKALVNILREQINVPEELAVIAFDESEALELFSVPISHVRQPIAQICLQAVKTLHDIIENVELKPGNIIYNSELILKTSSLPK